jgi:hypothetical protein
LKNVGERHLGGVRRIVRRIGHSCHSQRWAGEIP